MPGLGVLGLGPCRSHGSASFFQALVSDHCPHALKWTQKPLSPNVSVGFLPSGRCKVYILMSVPCGFLVSTLWSLAISRKSGEALPSPPHIPRPSCSYLDLWPCIPGSCPWLFFKREAPPGSPRSDLSLLSSAGGEGSRPKDQTTPFRGWQTFLPPRFRLLSHHTLMPLAKNKDKLPRSCIPHGPWIQRGFAAKVITGSVGYQPLARPPPSPHPFATRSLALPEGHCGLGQSLAQNSSFGGIPR